MRSYIFEAVRRSQRCYSSGLKSLIDINPEVDKALRANAPIVALESTIVTHGMPYPQNVETAASVEAIVRKQVMSFKRIRTNPYVFINLC